jgi:hypothetical protein
VIQQLRPRKKSVAALTAGISLRPLLLRRGGSGGSLCLLLLLLLRPPELSRCGLGRRFLLLLGFIERRLVFQGIGNVVGRSASCYRCLFPFLLFLLIAAVVVVALSRRRRLLPAASSVSSSSVAREARGKLREVDRGVFIVVVVVVLGWRGRRRGRGP